MTIGDWFLNYLEGFQVDIINDENQPVTADILCGYGDQTELDNWVARKNDDGSIKYPLIWIPIERGNSRQSWRIADQSIIILTDSNVTLLNDERFSETYTNVLWKVWNELYKKLLKSNSFNFTGGNKEEDRYSWLEKPSFGLSNGETIRLSQNNFVDKKGNKSIVSDVVDALIIDMKFEINTTNCN